MNRRSLIRGAAAMSAASYMRVLGANDRIQLGLIGCGDRGEYAKVFKSHAISRSNDNLNIITLTSSHSDRQTCPWLRQDS